MNGTVCVGAAEPVPGWGDRGEVAGMPPGVVHLLLSSDSSVETVEVGAADPCPVPGWLTQELTVSCVGVQKGVLTSAPEVDKSIGLLVGMGRVDVIWASGGVDEAGWLGTGV